MPIGACRVRLPSAGRTRPRLSAGRWPEGTTDAQSGPSRTFLQSPRSGWRAIISDAGAGAPGRIHPRSECAAPPGGGRRIGSRAVQSACGWRVRSRLVRSRRPSPCHPLSLAFALVAAITQRVVALDIALTAVPVAVWTVWALARNVPLAAVSVAIVIPVVVVQRSGQLEPVMFNVALLAFAAARWSGTLMEAASLGLVAAATPAFVALVQDPMEWPSASGSWPSSSSGSSVVRSLARNDSWSSSRTRRQLAQQALLAERRRIARDDPRLRRSRLGGRDASGDGAGACYVATRTLRRERCDPRRTWAAAACRSCVVLVTLLRSDDEARRRGACPHGERDSRARRPGTWVVSRSSCARGRPLATPAQRGARALPDCTGGARRRGSPCAAGADARHSGSSSKADESLSWRRPADLVVGGVRLGAGATSLRADRDAGAGDGARGSVLPPGRQATAGGCAAIRWKRREAGDPRRSRR